MKYLCLVYLDEKRLDELPDDEQPAAVLVERLGSAQVGSGVAAVGHLADQGVLPDEA